MAEETVTVTVEAGEHSEELTVPTALTDVLSEDDESPASVVADLAILSLAQQAHGIVHHSHGDADEELEAAEALVLETFEERFGQTFGEMTGHSH